MDSFCLQVGSSNQCNIKYQTGGFTCSDLTQAQFRKKSSSHQDWLQSVKSTCKLHVQLSRCHGCLRLEQQLSSRFPPFNILRRLYNIAEWIDLVDLDIQPVLLNELPKLACSLLQLLTCCNVVEQRGTHKLDVLWGETTTGSVSRRTIKQWEGRTPEQSQSRDQMHFRSSPCCPCDGRQTENCRK
jgi:hypothetical protein